MSGAKKTRSDAGLPATPFQKHTFRDFGTMNTQAARTALASNEFSWLENVMPLGHGNALIVPGPSAPLASGWNGIAYQMQGFNRGGANFMFVATNSGDAYEVALDFAGYTVSGVAVTSPGLSYFRACNLALAGAANVAAVVSVNIVLVGAYPQLVGLGTLPGTGYVVGDVLTLSGGTFLRAAQVQVTSIDGSGAPSTYFVLDQGDYSAIPLTTGIAVTGGTGTGALVAGWPTVGFPLAGFGLGGTVTISNPGAGYQAPPLASTTDGTFRPGGIGVLGTVTVSMAGTPHPVTHIGAGFSGGGLAMAQWSNERILIIDPAHGMFDWNGASLVTPTALFSLTITQPGAYTAVPTITFGGPGAGAAATANMGLNGIQVIAAGGAGYQVGDILTPQGGTFTQQAQVRVTTVAAGAVTAVAVSAPGSYTALPANPVATKATAGSSGAGCTLTANWGVLSATITAPGTGYTAAPTVTFSVGTASATANVMAAPTNPVDIAVFSQRVWIATADRKLWNSAAGAYNDFLSVSSGVKALLDPTLNSNVTSLFAANSYLYYTGVNSVNVISDVTVNANGNTTFSDTNLTASTGTVFGQTVIPYLRSTLFFSNDGVYSLYGSTPVKISEPMDGVYDGIDFHGLVSGGIFTLEKTLCAAFMVLYNTTGQPSNSSNSRQLMLVYFKGKHGDRWFVANQDGAGRMIVIAGAPANNPNQSKNLYGTDGTSLYQLFADPATTVSWTMQTAGWDMGDVGRDKEVNAFGFEQDGNTGGDVIVGLDMAQKEPPYVSSSIFAVALGNTVPWLNNQGNPIPWLNNAGGAIPWITSGYILDMQDVQENPAFGKYVGVTLTSNNTRGSINSILLRYSFRGDY